MTPAGGNPNGYDYGCSASRQPSSVRTARQIRLHVAEQNPWAALVVTAISRLDQLAAPG